ncbi:MAG: hypothetical protein H6914_03685 [Novosphingobium sp.]|nr:hypothetical protein [Novosphingobium sp.]
MVSDPEKRKRASKRADPRALSRFMEEFAWLMKSYDDLDFNALGQYSSELAMLSRHGSSRFRHAVSSGTTAMLVGVLPSFLVDEELFPLNEDIAEFSVSILDIHIPRWQKKSKYELIGHIVCNVNEASPGKISRLLEALEKILDVRGDARMKIARDRKSGRSWNQVIQEITGIY